MGSADGYFELTMGLYSDRTMITPIHEGSDVDVGDMMYVKIELHTEAEVAMHAVSCEAQSEDGAQSWPFFEAS